MNKKTIYWTLGITLALIILLVGFSVISKNRALSDDPPANLSEEEALDSYMKEQEVLMNKMMGDMENVTPTGNAALDFLTGMIPHHQAAVSMSDSYLKYGGKDDELRKLAKNIIRTQKQEIKEMKSLIDQIKKDNTQNSGQEQNYLKAYEKMLSSHQSDHSSHGTSVNVEAAFTEGMIMHHQMAVDMAQAIAGNTDHTQVTDLAQKIIETQQNEILQMQEILKRVSENSAAHH